MLVWGSDGRLLSLGRLDERECANCGRVQPFQLSLTYKFFHLYSIALFAFEKTDADVKVLMERHYRLVDPVN